MSATRPASSTREDPLEAGTSAAWLDPYVPRRWLSNAHLQTIIGNFLPRTFPLPEPESRLIEVEPAGPAHGPSFVLCHCHWQPEEVRTRRLTLVLVHGLEGSSSSRYVLGISVRALAAGLNVVRMNMRSCGHGEPYSPTIYHSGRSADVAAVMAELARDLGLESFAPVGYSMGGNLVLKLVGELGAAVPPYLKAAVGVSPLMDLAASSAALHEPQNRVYEWKFLLPMLERIRRKMKLFPGLYTDDGLDRIRSMREFDKQVVARYGGFASADDYYQSVASSNWAQQIAVPTLIIHSVDDPFIRMEAATRDKLFANPHVTFVETQYGGHCAFLTSERGEDAYWAEKTLLGFLLSTVKG
jgi:hypothetical protein